MTSTDLFVKLYENIEISNSHWWPGYGTFEVVVGAILIQNTTWQNAEKSIEILKSHNLLNVQNLANLSLENLATLIKPSGFYNQKAKRLNSLCKWIIEHFGDFENFKECVSREELLSQKGIGQETCDAILCYACEQDVMVSDSYTLRLLAFFGYEFQSYDECVMWLCDLDFDKIFALDERFTSEAEIYAFYHALIVEFCKINFKGRALNENGKRILKELL